MKFVACLVLQFLLLGAACAPAHAQSEFLSETFPYKAFDMLPTTPIAIGGATLNVGFASGKFALPRSALMAWLETARAHPPRHHRRAGGLVPRALVIGVAGNIFTDRSLTGIACRKRF